MTGLKLMHAAKQMGRRMARCRFNLYSHVAGMEVPGRFSISLPRLNNLANPLSASRSEQGVQDEQFAAQARINLVTYEQVSDCEFNQRLGLGESPCQVGGCATPNYLGAQKGSDLLKVPCCGKEEPIGQELVPAGPKPALVLEGRANPAMTSL
jgi:hypothetical protein